MHLDNQSFMKDQFEGSPEDLTEIFFEFANPKINETKQPKQKLKRRSRLEDQKTELFLNNLNEFYDDYFDEILKEF